MLWANFPARADQRLSPSEVDIARAHYATGIRYYDAGRFAEAAREFSDAYELSGRAELLFNVGRAYEHAGDPARALDAFRRYLQVVTIESQRLEMDRTISILIHRVGRLHVHCNVSGAVLAIDGVARDRTSGARWLEVNPGRHEITATKDGYPTGAASVLIEANKEASIELALQRPGESRSTPVYRRWWLWTTLGLVVAGGVVTGAVLGTRTSVPELSTHVLPAR